VLGRAYSSGTVVLTTGLIQLINNEDEIAAFMATALSSTDNCSGGPQQEKNEQSTSVKKAIWDAPADAIKEFVGTFQLIGSVLTLDDSGMQKAENRLHNLSYNRKLSPKEKVDQVYETKYYNDFQIIDEMIANGYDPAALISLAEKILASWPSLRAYSDNLDYHLRNSLLFSSNDFWKKYLEVAKKKVPKGNPSGTSASKSRWVSYKDEILHITKSLEEKFPQVPPGHDRVRYHDMVERKIKDGDVVVAIYYQKVVLEKETGEQFLNQEILALWNLYDEYRKSRGPNEEILEKELDINPEYFDKFLAEHQTEGNESQGFYKDVGMYYYRRLHFAKADQYLTRALELKGQNKDELPKVKQPLLYEVLDEMNKEDIEGRDKFFKETLFHELLRNLYLIQGRYDAAIKQQDWLISNISVSRKYAMATHLYRRKANHMRDVLLEAKARNLNPKLFEMDSSEYVFEIKDRHPTFRETRINNKL